MAENPEDIAICLPSHWGAVVRPTSLQQLVSVELVLREGQCHDALERLRLAIQTFNANLRFKKNYVGPSGKTASNNYAIISQ